MIFQAVHGAPRAQLFCRSEGRRRHSSKPRASALQSCRCIRVAHTQAPNPKAHIRCAKICRYTRPHPSSRPMHTTRLPHQRLVHLPLHLVLLAVTARADPTFLCTVNPSSLPSATRCDHAPPMRIRPLQRCSKTCFPVSFAQFLAVMSILDPIRRTQEGGDGDLTKELREAEGPKGINDIVSLIPRVRTFCLYNLLTTLLDSILQEL